MQIHDNSFSTKTALQRRQKSSQDQKVLNRLNSFSLGGRTEKIHEIIKLDHSGSATAAASFVAGRWGFGTTEDLGVVRPLSACVFASAIVRRTLAALLISSRVTSFTNLAAPIPFIRGTRCTPSRAFLVSSRPCTIRLYCGCQALKQSACKIRVDLQPLSSTKAIAHNNRMCRHSRP